MVNQLIQLAIALISAFGVYFISLLAHKAISLVEAKIDTEKASLRNEHIKSILEFADQAVTLAENSLDGGLGKKKFATNLLNQRLEQNGLQGNVTPEQVDQFLEKAVDGLKVKGLEKHAPKVEDKKEA
ncbi:phage holin, LLH family [Oenococcus alcoholitolerans]|uniref:Phage holin n=1 Tax=Oenococcus alcoholitolerans TaxID=931074 RepID=A0ABR4XPB9_9LACO|nr:hypothetical protein Q757_08155 [Oenococcus alcoholitolerans]